MNSVNKATEELRGFQMEVECVDEIFTLKQFSSKAIEKKQRERMYSL